jgi:hypothetical protein
MHDSTKEVDESNSGYEFAGIPLMPEAIRALIIELYTGKIVRRNDIVNRIPTVHAERGGTQSNASNLEASVKKALQYLKRDGLATNPGYGMWKIGSDNGSGTTLSDSFDLSGDSFEEERVGRVLADLEFGSGTSAIYLYYFEAYQSHPDAQVEERWPCKIGRTDRDPLQRILSQSTTALPEVPRISFVMKTAFPSSWESAIHSILRLRGRAIETAPGNEWFSTSPTEVLDLIRIIDPEIDIPPTS